MTDEVKRGPGRPPKVRLEVEDSFVVEPAVIAEQVIEVELLRKYAPGGQPQEVKQTVPAGTVIELPKTEAVRVLKLGIARATDNTFAK